MKAEKKGRGGDERENEASLFFLFLTGREGRVGKVGCGWEEGG